MLTEYGISKEQNNIYNQPYMYGFPDKIADYFNIGFKTKDMEEIPYRLHLSN